MIKIAPYALLAALAGLPAAARDVPPILQAERLCAGSGACLDREQEAYDALYEAWEGYDPGVRDGCVRSTGPSMSYIVLSNCIGSAVTNGAAEVTTPDGPRQPGDVVWGKAITSNDLTTRLPTSGDLPAQHRRNPWQIVIERPVDPSQVPVLRMPER